MGRVIISDTRQEYSFGKVQTTFGLPLLLRHSLPSAARESGAVYQSLSLLGTELHLEPLKSLLCSSVVSWLAF